MIHYVVGDATRPIGDGEKFIGHICNDRGGWGKGFVLALSKRWHEPEMYYRRWARSGEEEFCLGQVQAVRVAPDITVVNMLAQHGYKAVGDKAPIRLEALAQCLRQLSRISLDGSVHLPRIGTGLSGGKWSDIEPLITRWLGERLVFVYDLPHKD